MSPEAKIHLDRVSKTYPGTKIPPVEDLTLGFRAAPDGGGADAAADGGGADAAADTADAPLLWASTAAALPAAPSCGAPPPAACGGGGVAGATHVATLASAAASALPRASRTPTAMGAPLICHAESTRWRVRSINHGWDEANRRGRRPLAASALWSPGSRVR